MTSMWVVGRGTGCAAAVVAALLISTDLRAQAPLETPPSASAVAQPEGTAKPDVATLLFSRPQWEKAPPGSVLTYSYAKQTSDASFGPSFNDTVTLDLSAGEDSASRTAAVKMFSGSNAKPAGPFRSDQQNPVLLLVLEENVQELSASFKANPRFLKNAIRRAWRDDAVIVPAQVEAGGKQVPGTRITVQPFIGIAEADKMKGLETMVYTVDIADSVPGNIAAIDIRAPAQGASKFSETLRFEAKAP